MYTKLYKIPYILTNDFTYIFKKFCQKFLELYIFIYIRINSIILGIYQTHVFKESIIIKKPLKIVVFYTLQSNKIIQEQV